MFKDKQRNKEMLQVTLGAFIVACGFFFFYSHNGLVTGGATGLSLILSEVTGYSNSIFIWILNISLLVLGLIVLGKTFFFKTVYGTIVLAVLITVLELIFKDFDLLSSVTNNSTKLLISGVCGGFFTGLGLGLVFKNNVTTGGSDVIQTILHKKLKLPYSLALYITDGVIILLGLLVFNVEHAFFAVVSLVIAGAVIDRVVVHGKAGYTVFIVTTNYHALKAQIYNNVNRGVTKVSAVGGYSESEKDMLICTISRAQLYNLKQVINEVDPSAFTFITKTVESVGIGFK